MLQRQVGGLEQRLRFPVEPRSLRDHEFKVHSQWGEDGIIQYLIRQIDIPNKVFVEFGVTRYTECNTRYLLHNDNWHGLVMDGNADGIAYARADRPYLYHSLDAVCAFIDRDNINDLIRGNGIKDDIGLLSVDIDGNDYWVWEAIDCIQPRIVIVEYNSTFGRRDAVSIPYDPTFFRNRAHFSRLYYGASAPAMAHLGRQKGYTLVGGNTAGNNLFFLRDDVAEAVPAATVDESYARSMFRESFGPDGVRTFLPFDQRQVVLAALPVVDVVTGEERRVGDLDLS